MEPPQDNLEDEVHHLFEMYPSFKEIFANLAFILNVSLDSVKSKLGYNDKDNCVHLLFDFSQDERTYRDVRIIRIAKELFRILCEDHPTFQITFAKHLRDIVVRLCLQFVTSDPFRCFCDYCGRKIPFDHVPRQCNLAVCRRYFDVCGPCENSITHGHFNEGSCFRHSEYYLNQWSKRRSNQPKAGNLAHFLRPDPKASV